MKDLETVGPALIRMKRINFNVEGNIFAGQVQLKLDLESHHIGITPDGQKVVLDAIIKISAPDGKIGGEFQMECVSRLKETVSPDEIVNERDTTIIEKNIQNLFRNIFDQISFSISTVFTQFGLSPLDLSKVLKIDSIKLKQPPAPQKT